MVKIENFTLSTIYHRFKMTFWETNKEIQNVDKQLIMSKFMWLLLGMAVELCSPHKNVLIFQKSMLKYSDYP